MAATRDIEKLIIHFVGSGNNYIHAHAKIVTVDPDNPDIEFSNTEVVRIHQSDLTPQEETDVQGAVQALLSALARFKPVV